MTKPSKPPAQPQEPPPQVSEDDVLRRMLNTPPVPHTKPAPKKKPARKPAK